jgi:hypothetical protein
VLELLLEFGRSIGVIRALGFAYLSKESDIKDIGIHKVEQRNA